MIEKQRLNNHFLYWLTSFKICKLVYLFLILLISILICNYYLKNEVTQPISSSDQDFEFKRNQLFYEKYNLHDFKDILKQENLEQRLSELLRIRQSILNELVYLENRRQKQQEEITTYALKLEEIKTQIVHKQNELTRIHLSLEQAEYSQKEAVLKNRPFISTPLKIDNDDLFQVNLTNNFKLTNKNIKKCSMHHCFDYSKCPLVKKLNVYLDFNFVDKLDEKDDFNRFLKLSLVRNAELSFNLIDNSDELDNACLIIVPVFNKNQAKLIGDNFKLKTNVLIINFNLDEIANNDADDLPTNGKFMIAQNDFYEDEFRSEFDLILPSLKYIKSIFKLNQQITSTAKHFLHCPGKLKLLKSYFNLVKSLNFFTFFL